MSRRPRARRQPQPEWAEWTDEELLDLRFMDLGLKLDGTWLQGPIARLHEELGRKGLRFRPHFWFSTEWFSPDGIPGIAIPFYLAHPRLMRLERRQMLEVEGGSREWCMRILRHECGHAIDTAYRLRRTRRWRDTFGRATLHYPSIYRPHPASRNHVLHLDGWYAQSHPIEDFAETFAVWLRPGSRWKRTYAGWPALQKLEYVDEVLEAVGATPPLVRLREQMQPVARLRRTLRSHYRSRRARYGVDVPDVGEEDLEELFEGKGPGSRRESASGFLRRHRPDLRELVARWTRQHPYVVDQHLRQMVKTSRALGLRVGTSERQTLLAVAVVLAFQVSYAMKGSLRVTL